MRKRELLTYLLGWTAYVLFSFLMYPELQVTVFLFSIPLTMLSGWLFRYKGAVITILLLIPYHYVMLSYHSDAPNILIETLNPVGIGTQLVFSMSTALFRITQQKYQQLNSYLETAVLERTADLTRLTDHLIETKEMMFALTEEGLLKEPINKLTSMLETNRLLARHLVDADHPGVETSITIDQLIRLCINQLNTMGKNYAPNTQNSKVSSNPIDELLMEYALLAGKKTQILKTGNWKHLNSDMLHRIHPFISEALSNALRHANPKEITIGIQNKPASFIIFIENDGTPMPAKIQEGMGLPLMRYYARRAGGLFSLNDGAGENTRVECAIPR